MLQSGSQPSITFAELIRGIMLGRSCYPNHVPHPNPLRFPFAPVPRPVSQLISASVHDRSCYPNHLPLPLGSRILEAQISPTQCSPPNFQPSQGRLAQAGSGCNSQWQDPHANLVPLVLNQAAAASR